MTDKQMEWRRTLATCYVLVAFLAFGLGVLRFGNDSVFYREMYIAVICVSVSTGLSNTVLRALNARLQVVARESQNGWKRANDQIQELLEHSCPDDDTRGT